MTRAFMAWVALFCYAKLFNHNPVFAFCTNALRRNNSKQNVLHPGKISVKPYYWDVVRSAVLTQCCSFVHKLLWFLLFGQQEAAPLEGDSKGFHFKTLLFTNDSGSPSPFVLLSAFVNCFFWLNNNVWFSICKKSLPSRVLLTCSKIPPFPCMLLIEKPRNFVLCKCSTWDYQDLYFILESMLKPFKEALMRKFFD